MCFKFIDECCCGSVVVGPVAVPHSPLLLQLESHTSSFICSGFVWMYVGVFDLFSSFIRQTATAAAVGIVLFMFWCCLIFCIILN